jgi:uracil-DNA glycosylase
MNYNSLFGDSWGPKLQEQISPKKLKSIFDYLKDQSSQAGNIFPKPEKIFRCFKECPFNKTMVVFLGTNPYYNDFDLVPDGILFSAMCRGKLLTNIYRAIEDNYDTKLREIQKQPDLTLWAHQGVLLLPLDLTMEQGKKKAHIKLWEPFIRAVISALQKDAPGVIYVLLGQDSLTHADLIDTLNHDMICLEHPVKALLMKRNWKHKNVFNYLDRVTNMIFNRKINWYD